MLVIDNNGLHGRRERSGAITLTPGYHDIRVEFFENTDGAGLSMPYAGPGVTKRVVPASVLVH